MRLLNLWPAAVYPPDLTRSVHTLSAAEWRHLIETFETLRQAFEEAEGKATAEWLRRFPREQYANAEEWAAAAMSD